MSFASQSAFTAVTFFLKNTNQMTSKVVSDTAGDDLILEEVEC